MSSVSSVRIPGLATGMDTDKIIKDMLTGEQNKIDKVKQKEQAIKWQQEIYRNIIKDVKGFQDDYFSITSPNSIISSKSWNTLSVNSSDSNVITATGSAGAKNINYKFEVSQLASAGKGSTTTATNNVKITKDSNLKDLGITDGETKIWIRYGDKENEVSSEITLRTEPLYKYEQEKDVDGNLVVDADGKPVYDMTKPVQEKDADGKPVYEQKKDVDGKLIVDADGKPVYDMTKPVYVVDEPADTVATLINKINEASGGKIRASYSEMTGAFTIEGMDTGSKNGFTIVGADKKTASGALDFLNLSGKDAVGKFKGTDSNVKVYGSDGIEITNNPIDNSSNSFTIDGITYDLHGVTKAGEKVGLTSKQDAQPVVDNMKKFVEDYNKIMDKVYDLVTEKGNRDYPPLTEEQKKDMDEDEIKRWEDKAKKGVLRNDSEMRRFMDDMQNAIFGENSKTLSEFGLTTHPDYNKRGQLSLDTEKFKKAIQNNGEKVYDIFASGNNSVMEKMKDTMYKYVGTSSSLFAKKAGIEKTASVANNFYSEQIKQKQENIKNIQRKMQDKEQQLYKKFAALEASMNKFNSQMNHLMGQ